MEIQCQITQEWEVFIFGFASVQCKLRSTEACRVGEGGKEGSFDGRERMTLERVHGQGSLWVRGEVTGEAQSPVPLWKVL